MTCLTRGSRTLFLLSSLSPLPLTPLPLTSSPPLQECHLEDYDPSLAVIADYSTIVIQYGYVTLFVAACPVVRVIFAIFFVM